MKVKNVSARGWGVMGVFIKPGCTEEVEGTKADIGENPDLVIIEESTQPAQEPKKPGRPPKAD